VAERRAKLPPPPPAPGDDSLAELNDHFGRFLRQADELIDEWARFGAGVRARLDEQLRDVESAFARGADAAAARAAQAMARGLDEAAAARVDRVLGERVASLRAELEKLERIARGVGGAAAPRGSDPMLQRIWLAAIAMNVLIVVLIAIVWSRTGSSAAPPPIVERTPAVAPSFDAAPPDAMPATPPDATPPDAAPPDAAPARPPIHGHRPAAAHP